MDNDKELAPIVLFVYNRPWHTQQTLEALKQNLLSDVSTLYIYADGPKSNETELVITLINETRELIKREKWCGTIFIIEREDNLGLAKNILRGVTEIIEKHGKVIVLEDDIKPEPHFLNYMNKALDYFKDKAEVFHINGFNNETNLQFLLPEFYFLKFMSCWGWATWKDRWEKLKTDPGIFYDQLMGDPKNLSEFNYDDTLNFHLQLKSNIEGKINSWAIFWYSTIFFEGGYCLTPKFSFVENIGMDGTGVHCGKDQNYKKLYKNRVSDLPFKRLSISESFMARLHLKLFYKYGQKFRPNWVLKKKARNLKSNFMRKLKREFSFL